MSEYSEIIHTAVTVSSVCGAYMAIRKVIKDGEKTKKDHHKEFMDDAKKEFAKVEAKLKAEIQALEADLANLKLNVSKDVDHLKETYNNEIRNLGQKIEELRVELNQQHGHLVQLLTEMVKKR